MRSQYYPSIRIKRKSWQQQSPLPPIAQSAHLRVCTVTKKKKRRKKQRGEESTCAKPTYGASNVYRMHGVSPEVDVWFFSDAHLPVRALCTLTEIMVAFYHGRGSSFGGALRRETEERGEKFILAACNQWTSSSSNRSLLRSVTITGESHEINRDR